MASRKCRHVVSMDTIKHRCDVVDAEHRGHAATGLGCMNWKTCAKCGAWLSLGPSNDKPEAVKVEMRAAEIVSVDDDAEVLSTSEFAGYLHNMTISQWVLDGEKMVPIDFLAGYLARCIATHDDNGNKPEG